MTELAGRVPCLYVIPVPKVGHGIHRDNLPEFMRVVDDFTSRVGL